MESSVRGCMAVFAVSGSVVLVALKVHKRLLSDFMKKIEFELGLVKGQGKKKVRFSDEVEEVPPVNAGDHRHYHYPKKHVAVTAVVTDGKQVVDDERFKSMPENWQVLYKGIIQSRTLKGYM